MDIEILFHSSSTPKNVSGRAVYTKGQLLCIECEPDQNGDILILKYPLLNVFCVSHIHGRHKGTEKR